MHKPRYLNYLLSIAISAVLLSSTAYANPANLKPVGEATMTWWGFTLYQAALKTRTGEYQERQYPLYLELTYARPLKSEWILQATDQQWQHLGVAEEKRQAWLDDLATLLPDVQTGDRLALYMPSAQQHQFYHNGKVLGRVNDPTFAEQFLAIWLSPRTSRPEIRAQLIQAANP